MITMPDATVPYVRAAREPLDACRQPFVGERVVQRRNGGHHERFWRRGVRPAGWELTVYAEKMSRAVDSLGRPSRAAVLAV
jgi:hypothetical protein